MVALNQNVMSFDTIPAFEAYGKVRLDIDENQSLFAPQSGYDEATGRELVVFCPWGTQTMANNILSDIQGYAYQPFNADGAILDPAAQLGDGVSVNGVTSVLNAIGTRFSSLCSANISAPQDEEIDHEYPYESKENREITRSIANTRARLTVLSDSITAEVTRAQGAEDELSTQISIVAGEVSSKISSAEAQSMIQQSATSILATVSDNYYGKQTSVSITADGLEINTGGSFTVNAGADISMTGSNFSVSNGNISITGTLSAAAVYAGNILTGTQYGSIGSNANKLTAITAINGYFTGIHTSSEQTLTNTVGSTTYADTRISGAGLTFKGSFHGWQDIIDGGGGAVWG